MLARTRKGYANLTRLFTCANLADRIDPKLDVSFLHDYSEGIILLTGCGKGAIPRLLSSGKHEEARDLLRVYLDWFGRDSLYVELQRNLLPGETARNRGLLEIARELEVAVVATNDVHYHSPQRWRLQNVLTAIKNNSTLEEAIHLLKPNSQFYLKPQAEMEQLFQECPEAIRNTSRIAEECSFNLSTDLGYKLPDPTVPEGHTTDSYLRKLCYEAALRRYGGLPKRVKERIEEELRLIERHFLAGFILLYRDIVQTAHEIMVEEGHANPETPLEMRPHWMRQRGSSVAMLVGYLIGISHVDPLVYNLPLERFLPEDLKTLPDIDLDFPRGLREKLIERIHNKYGLEHAVLAGAIATYQIKGIIADVGKALGLPQEDLKRLSESIHSNDPTKLKSEMLELPEFKGKVDAPGWRDLIQVAPQLIDAPKGVGQHVGGMILSSSPIPDMVPLRKGAIEGRYIMDWDKDSVTDAGFAKIDLLSLPVLDQIEQSLDLIEKRTGRRPDLGRTAPDDPAVYDMINQGRCMGVFLLQSPAQLKMGQRLKSRNLVDLAYQVALITARKTTSIL